MGMSGPARSHAGCGGLELDSWDSVSLLDPVVGSLPSQLLVTLEETLHAPLSLAGALRMNPLFHPCQ